MHASEHTQTHDTTTDKETVMTYAQKIFREQLAASAPDWRAGLAIIAARAGR